MTHSSVKSDYGAILGFSPKGYRDLEFIYDETNYKKTQYGTSEINALRHFAINLCAKEFYKISRLRRKAFEHHCSATLVEELRKEAEEVRSAMECYPERIIDNSWLITKKYAFHV